MRMRALVRNREGNHEVSLQTNDNVHSLVEVEVDGEFGAEGAPANQVSYRARVEARAGEEVIRDLMHATDRVAEVQNTLRVSTPVTLLQIEAVSV
jgi:hypothetical protein